MKPPKRKNPTPKEWYEQNLKEGYSLTDNFSEQEVNDRIARGKYLTFYNPKIYKRNESGGYVNINYPDATIDSPEYGGEPVRSFKPDAIPQKYNALEPKVTIAPGHKPVEIGPSVTYNPNTKGYTNSVTQEVIDPTIIEQKAKGGLVGKVKGYNTGGLTGLDKKAAAAGFGVSGLGGAAQMAGELGSNLINDDPNEQGIVNTNKAAWSNSLSNAGKGAAMGASIGSVIPGVGTVIGGGIGLLAGGIGGFIGGKNKAEAANEEVEKQIEAEKQAEFDAKAAASQRSALSQRMLENYAQGGKVEGKGTAKSDSIPAKVKEDSFVIPAENAPIAEVIRKKVLKAPVKKANLKQTGGEPVKLSDGEHLFTPKEVEELAAKGIDLNKLAPEAQSKLRDELNCGGKVKGYADGGKVTPENKAKLYDAIYGKSDISADKKVKLYDAIFGPLPAKYHPKIESDGKIKVTEITKEDAAKLFDEGGRRKYDEVINTAKSAGQEKFIIDPASPEIPTAKELDAYKASEAIKKSPSLAAPRRAATSGLNNTVTTESLPSVAATLPSAPADLELRTSPTVTDEQLAANPLGLDGTAPAAGGGSGTGAGGQKTDFGGLANQLINFGVPAIQTALGTKMLKEAGARPVDELDPDYLASIDAARNNLDLAKANAKFGFTPEEQALLNQENAAATSAARASARNYSGGSAANAYNMEMNAINQGNQRGLAAKVQNRALMLQKQRDALAQQGYVDNLVSGKAQMNRALFGDDLTAWKEKQGAGGQLVGAGLSNLAGAARYNQELDFMKGLANKYRV